MPPAYLLLVFPEQLPGSFFSLSYSSPTHWLDSLYHILQVSATDYPIQEDFLVSTATSSILCFLTLTDRPFFPALPFSFPDTQLRLRLA